MHAPKPFRRDGHRAIKTPPPAATRIYSITGPAPSGQFQLRTERFAEKKNARAEPARLLYKIRRDAELIGMHSQEGFALRLIIWAISMPVFALILHVLKMRSRILRIAGILPHNRFFQAVLLFTLCLGGRLALLHEKPVPVPMVHDEYSYLLAADTFAHGRLTNPTPQFWSHFETYQELLHPTYMAKYPPGQGIALAAGQIFFHLPFAGVMLSCAFMCMALYWALCSIVPQRWAFLGGIVAVIQIGWLGYWDNSYWGGAMAALGGCLFIGALLRLTRRFTVLHAATLAFSLFLLAITRPYEGLLLAFPGLLWLAVAIARNSRKELRPRALTAFLLILAAGGSWMGYYNWRVTGWALKLPYIEFHRQYEATPIFAFQHMASPGNIAVSDQKNQYEKINHPIYMQYRIRNNFLVISFTRARSIWTYLSGSAFLLAPLGLFLCWRNRKIRWLTLLLAFMFVGWEAESWLFMHYYAPATPVIYALGLIGLRALCCWKRKQHIGQLLIMASLLFFALATVAELAQGPVFKMLNIPYQPANWNETNFLRQKASAISILDNIPGNHMVLVHYFQEHDPAKEWVYNGYDIPGQRIIWAHDLDPPDPDKPLICHYRNRHVWLISPYDSEVWTPSLTQKSLQPINTSQMCVNSGESSEEQSPELTPAGEAIGVN